jgi:hypothetical protein
VGKNGKWGEMVAGGRAERAERGRRWYEGGGFVMGGGGFGF